MRGKSGFSYFLEIWIVGHMDTVPMHISTFRFPEISDVFWNSQILPFTLAPCILLIQNLPCSRRSCIYLFICFPFSRFSCILLIQHISFHGCIWGVIPPVVYDPAAGVFGGWKMTPLDILSMYTVNLVDVY